MWICEKEKMAANESRANKMSTLLEYNNFVLNDIRATVMPNFSVLLLFYSLRHKPLRKICAKNYPL